MSLPTALNASMILEELLVAIVWKDTITKSAPSFVKGAVKSARAACMNKIIAQFVQGMAEISRLSLIVFVQRNFMNSMAN